jgi:lysozyme family protein
MNEFDRSLIKWLIEDIEGGVADLSKDRGGWTYKGLSSRYFPEVRTMYENGTITDEYVYQVYYREYMLSIAYYKDLAKKLPWFVKLAFPAKVHGSGFRQLTKVTQRGLNTLGMKLVTDGLFGPKTARALLSLDKRQEQSLIDFIRSNFDDLVLARQKSVGAYQAGIRNRVIKEYDFAFDRNVSMPDSIGPSEVIASAKLPSVSPGVNRPVVQVADSQGWEQLPVGMDTVIEIRGVDYASNTASPSADSVTT